MEPSKEKKDEALERRKVKALEAIAEHLETLAGAVEHIETLASAVEPAREEWRDPEGYGPDYSGHNAYLRTSG